MSGRRSWRLMMIFGYAKDWPRLLSYSALALPVLTLAFWGTLPARAGMGESDVTAGLQEDAANNKLIFGCTLGNACLGQDGVQYRLFSANRADNIFRGGSTIETNKTISGIGFGSLVSTQQTTPPILDTLCWSGERTSNPGGKLSQGFRDCAKIFTRTSPSDRSGSCSSTVIRTSQSGDQCNSVESAFADPPNPNPQFDYLIKIDPTRFGQTNSVEVTRCSDQVVAQCADAAKLGNNVSVAAQTGMAAYDCLLYRYGRCLY
jgi:hypothetical protein